MNPRQTAADLVDWGKRRAAVGIVAEFNFLKGMPHA